MYQAKIPYRNHHSFYPIDSLHHVRPLIGTCKPKGLWYSFNWYWVENLANDYWFHDINYEPEPDKFYPNCSYLYEVFLDECDVTTLDKFESNKVLRLTKRSEYKKFADLYVTKIKDEEEWEYHIIDWLKVADTFCGIELPNYNHERIIRYNQEETKWMYGWDIPSGCIWNIDIIKKFERALEG